MPAIGYVTRQEDGSFKGQLRTLSIRADIEIVPNRTKNTESQPDYRIVTNSIEVGAAWRRTSRDTGASYVSLSSGRAGIRSAQALRQSRASSRTGR